LADNLSDVPEDIFQWKWRFCERNKNCAARKKYSESETSSEESDSTSNAEATTWVKEDKTPNLGPFTGNPGAKQIPSDRTKVSEIIEFFSETTSLKCYPRRLICIIFKIKENMIAVLRGLKWVDDSVVCATHKKRSETRYDCKFCLVPLHKGECFQRYCTLKHY
jgi:hypothetical protein